MTFQDSAQAMRQELITQPTTPEEIAAVRRALTTHDALDLAPMLGIAA